MSDYLIHSAKGTSWEKAGHKYVWKKKKNGKWVYYYGKKEGGGFEGYSTESSLDAINNAYENTAREITELKRAEQYSSGKEKEFIEKEIEKKEKQLTRITYDKNSYIRDMKYYTTFKDTCSKSIEVGKKVLNSVKNIKYLPEKIKKQYEKANKSYEDKYGKYFKK